MQRSTLGSSPIVVDASLAVWALLPVMPDIHALRFFSEWQLRGATLHAPALWPVECTSAIRRYAFAGVITQEEARIAVDDLFRLGVQVVPTTSAVCRQALTWAERLNQAKAYDGFYLTLAAEIDAILYTGDRRLANSASQLGLTWVRWIGDATPP